MKASKRIAIIALVFATIFLPSCVHDSFEVIATEETVTEKTITQNLKVVDMLEAIADTPHSAVSVTYLLLENGDIVVYSACNIRLPYTYEQARQIIAFRRGEEVTVSIKADNDDIPLR